MKLDELNKLCSKIYARIWLLIKSNRKLSSRAKYMWETMISRTSKIIVKHY